MKSFKIEVVNYSGEEIIKDYLENWEDYFDSEEECKKFEALYNKVLGTHEMSTLEEYFNLLEDVCELTDSEYECANNGTTIFLFE